MKVENFLSVLIVLVVTCNNGVKSQHNCGGNFTFQGVNFAQDEIEPKVVGVIAIYALTNATSVGISGDFVKYFSVELDTGNELLIISTTHEFINYEIEQTETIPGIGLSFNCTSGNAATSFRFYITEQNNYDPKFSFSSYEVIVPTPLPRGFDITYFMKNDEITAIDYDLYANNMTFDLSGSNMFRVEDIFVQSGKPFYKLQILTKQNILFIDGDELDITITATDTSEKFAKKSSSVILKIISDPDNKFEGEISQNFEQSLYRGDFSEIDEKLMIYDVVFNSENYNENVTFELSGDDASIFKIDQNENVVKILLESGVPTDEIMKQSIYIFTINALEFGSVISSTTILITTQEAKAPSFDKSFYTGTVNHTLKHEQISVDESDVEVFLSGPSYFNISISDKIVTVFIKPGEVIPDNEKVFVIKIFAKSLTTNKTTESLLVVTVENEFDRRLEFSKNFYEGTISKTLTLSIEDISITNSDAFNITIGGKDSNFIDTTISGNLVQLNLKNQADIPKDVSYLQMTLTASAENFLSAQTMVILGIERENNSTEIDLAQPYFETSYSFSIFKNKLERIGEIQAFVPDGSLLIYELSFSGISLADKLTINNFGELIVNDAISPGFYEFQVIAKNGDKTATTRITLSVLEIFCEGDTHVEKTLAVEHLAENGIYSNIMYSKINECEFEILSVVPSSLRSIFTIDPSSHYLKNTLQFDREDISFSNQKTPQIQITLDLKCNDTSPAPPALNQPWLSEIITDEISFSATKTILNIIIDDENDNAPVFTNPISDYQIGFPDEALAERIMPPYLMKVEAIDADEGINAKIKFSVNPSAHFEIDPENGEIYPIQSFSESTTLKIFATDKDGASDGLKSEINLNIIKLPSDSVTQMTISNFNENLENLISELSNAVNLDIRVINHAPIANDIETAKQLSNFNNAKLIIYAYAFGSGGQLIKAQDLIDALITAGYNMKFSLIGIEGEAPECKSQSIAGWIAAVVVLSILLVIVITTPLVYFFIIKKRVSEPEQRRDSESSSKEIQDNFYSEPGQSTPTTLPNRETEDESETTAATSENQERVGEEVVEICEASTSSEADRLNNRLLSILDDDSSDDRKNVSFKEYVERIEVLEDDQK